MTNTGTRETESTATIRFRLSFWDSLLAIRAVWNARPVLRWLRRTAWLLVLGGFITAVASERLMDVAITLMLLGLLVAVIFAINAPLLAWMTRAGNPLAREEQVWKFDAGGITTTAGSAQSVVSWSAVSDLFETRRFLLISFSDQQHCPIPKRSFGSSGALDVVRRLFAERSLTPAGHAVPAQDSQLGNVRIRVSFQFTVGTLYRASVAVSKHGMGLWKIYVSMLGIGLLLGGPGIASQLSNGETPSAWTISSLVWPVLLVFVLGRLGGLWWAYSHLRSSKMAREEQVIEITDRGIAAHGPAYNATMPYKAMTKVVETREFVLFYLAKVQALTLPKAELTADQLAWLRQFLASEFGARFVATSP